MYKLKVEKAFGDYDYGTSKFLGAPTMPEGWLSDGTLSDDGTGMFKELYSAILEGAVWHKPDHYYLLLDFEDFLEKKIKVNRDYKDNYEFNKKCWLNMCNAGKFSSDRTIKEYADEIWKIK